ncbi:MAG: long-chain fatty acid--CoA ligase [Candidatus Thorarchaeota archaeon]
MKRFWHVSWPEELPHDIDVPNTTIHETLTATAKQYPTNPAYYFQGKAISFQEIDLLSNKLANALIQLGVNKGDRVAFMLPNVPQSPLALFGILKAGAIVTPINPLFKRHELHHQLDSAGVTHLISLDLFHGVVEAGCQDTNVESVIYTRTGEYLSKAKAILGRLARKIPHPKLPVGSNIHQLQNLLAGKSTSPPSVKTHPDDIAALLYTGGTTGPPKGAMLSHRNLMFNAKVGSQWFDVQVGEECFVGVLPAFHAFGFSCVIVLSTLIAASVILIPRPEIKEILKSIQQYQATVLVSVPTLYISLLASPLLKKFNISSLKHCFSGAASLPIEVLEQFQKETGSYIVEGYGMTETSPILTLIPEGVLKPGAVGIPTFNTDIKIVAQTDDSKEMPIGEWGEILAKGPQIFQGYWDAPAASANTLRDGWIHTGDIGRFDDNGYLYIGDRKKDLIKRSGYSIFPAEVEALLYKHPAVAECAVIGVPEPRVGEEVKAIIVLKPEFIGQIAEPELQEWAKQEMAAYKYPRLIEFRDDLPKSAVGKILRRELRQV